MPINTQPRHVGRVWITPNALLNLDVALADLAAGATRTFPAGAAAQEDGVQAWTSPVYLDGT